MQKTSLKRKNTMRQEFVDRFHAFDYSKAVLVELVAHIARDAFTK